LNYYILTGAGFSKNFGGWVSSELWAFLIGHHTIQNNEKLKELLWNNKNNGFENALHEVKKNAENNEEWKETYIVLQNVISEAFEEMNESYQSVTPGQGVYYIERFLGHFNVIFTTNQDTLVENKFLNLKIGVPGMSSNTHLCGGDISKTIYYPTEHCDIPQHLIPYNPNSGLKKLINSSFS
jgi:hypothetical protein